MYALIPTMISGTTQPEVQKEPRDIVTSGRSRRKYGIDNAFKGRTTKLCIALFLIVASLHNVTIVNNNRSSDLFLDSAPSNLEERILSFSEKWSEVKLLIYMTTHLPDAHVAFLPCWKDAIERLDIFKYADLMLFTSADPTNEQLKLLPFRNIEIKRYRNPGYQSGAVQAMVEPFLDNVTWFDDYDWVMRVNPDVLIRDDQWLMQTMLNTTVDMIVHECVSTNKYKTNALIHTDFFAFRPSAVDRERLLNANRDHAETHFTTSFRHLYDSGRFAYVEGGKNAIEGHCRIEGVGSPVLHVHELSNYCPYYYNITKEGFYR